MQHFTHAKPTHTLQLRLAAAADGLHGGSCERGDALGTEESRSETVKIVSSATSTNCGTNVVSNAQRRATKCTNHGRNQHNALAATRARRVARLHANTQHAHLEPGNKGLARRAQSTVTCSQKMAMPLDSLSAKLSAPYTNAPD